MQTQEQKAINVNRVNIIGELVENNLEIKTSTRDGKEFIAGNIVVKSILDGREQLTEIELYSPSTKKDGTSNKLFETYSGLDKFLGKRVDISGELQENRYYNQSTSQVVSWTRIRGVFVSEVRKNTDDAVKFEYAGYVVKPLTEKLNKNNELLYYEMTIAQANYNFEKALETKFAVHKDNRAAVNFIESNYDVGATVKVAGSINIITEEVTSEDATAAFGEPIVRTFTNTYVTRLVTTGSAPITGQGEYSQDLMNTLNATYKQDALEIEANAKSDGVETTSFTETKKKAAAKQNYGSLL